MSSTSDDFIGRHRDPRRRAPSAVMSFVTITHIVLTEILHIMNIPVRSSWLCKAECHFIGLLYNIIYLTLLCRELSAICLRQVTPRRK